jgi:uncharacterized protein YndB with AHSA1/START domain
MTEYHFVTDWQIAAPVEAVFEALVDSRRWPEWWHGVRSVEEIAAGNPDGIGNVRRYVFRARLPYDLAFEMRTTRIEPPTALEGEASGELAGTGRWRLEPVEGGTHVRYLWDVRTTRAWMNLLAPVARPLFAWNHDAVMRWGEQGLRAHLRDPRH